MGAANHLEVKQSKGKDVPATVVPVPKDLPPNAAEKREPEKVWPLHLSFLQFFLLSPYNSEKPCCSLYQCYTGRRLRSRTTDCEC